MLRQLDIYVEKFAVWPLLHTVQNNQFQMNWTCKCERQNILIEEHLHDLSIGKDFLGSKQKALIIIFENKIK